LLFRENILFLGLKNGGQEMKNAELVLKLKGRDETPKHRKRRAGKNRFTILYRCVPDSSCQRMFGDKWHKWGKYKTEARRDQAMESLSVGGIGSAHGVKCFEYKKGEI
jgi:hypothetical protein